MQDEFVDLNPLIPSHYFFLLKKSIKAIRDNDFKVSQLLAGSISPCNARGMTASELNALLQVEAKNI